MELALVRDVQDLIEILLVFCVGCLICLNISKYLQLTKRLGLILYCWHTLFCVVYVLYALNYVADATAYYQAASQGDYVWGVGTAAIIYITTPFVNVFGFSFLTVNLVFNIIGSIGLLLFYASLRAEVASKQRGVRRLALLVAFLPSVSFWSSALGKEPLSFMAGALALWAALRLSKRHILMVVAITIMFVVRPHMAGLIVVALGASFIFSSNQPGLDRIFWGCVTVAVASAMVPFALDYAGVQGGTTEDVYEYMESRQAFNMAGGGSVDISAMSLPLKIVTYLFRPLPFEAFSITSFLTSLENIVLISIFICGFTGLWRRHRFTLSANRVFMWWYAGASLFVLASTTANLGISVRQKWMFVPMLIFLALSYTGRRTNPRVQIAG